MSMHKINMWHRGQIKTVNISIFSANSGVFAQQKFAQDAKLAANILKMCLITYPQFSEAALRQAINRSVAQSAKEVRAEEVRRDGPALDADRLPAESARLEAHPSEAGLLCLDRQFVVACHKI